MRTSDKAELGPGFGILPDDGVVVFNTLKLRVIDDERKLQAETTINVK